MVDDVVQSIVRRLLLLVLVLSGCRPALEFNSSNMTPDQMLNRATLVFVGTIESQTFINWPMSPVPGEHSRFWMVLLRRVRVEAIARGAEPNNVIDVYEIFWTGGANGDWNATQNGGRYLFLVRKEGGRYHVVRDWWRSIFDVGSGKHDRFPLNDSHSIWERFALLQYWVQPGWRPSFPTWTHNDPGMALGLWRQVKILRGLSRHSDPELRASACKALFLKGRSQDECYETLQSERRSDELELSRRWEGDAAQRWAIDLATKHQSFVMDELRLFTTVNNRKMREHFCAEFQRAFPGDKDNGCPADKPPPATMVTADGDVQMDSNTTWSPSRRAR